MTTKKIKEVIAKLKKAANKNNKIADNSVMRRTGGDRSRIVSVDSPETTEDHGASTSKAKPVGPKRKIDKNDKIANNSVMALEITPKAMRRTGGDRSRIVSLDKPETTEDHERYI